MRTGLVPEGILTGIPSGTQLQEPRLFIYMHLWSERTDPSQWVHTGFLQPIHLLTSQMMFAVLLVGLV